MGGIRRLTRLGSGEGPPVVHTALCPNPGLVDDATLAEDRATRYRAL
jgi:hypothetical protein